MNTEELYDVLYDYFNENIEHFGQRYRWALDTIDRDRCPLSMADEKLFNQMYNRLEDYCDDNEIDIDFIDLDEIFG